MRRIVLFGYVGLFAAAMAFLVGVVDNAHTEVAMRGKYGQPGESGEILLPSPKTDGSISVEASLKARRSTRSFTADPLSLAEVSQLLWAAQGITAGGRFRTAPSAGATYPLEIILVAGRVKGLIPGVYRYNPRKHALETLAAEDRRQQLAAAALNQSVVRDASAVMVISAVMERTTTRYGNRGVRYVHMEVGHAGQNIHLQAEALGLGTVVIGAFHDAQVSDVLRLEPDETPLYLMPVGRKKEW